ncbi:MAG: hypothetical protein LBP59_03145 [Planctomycetaceae bacterium]|jgi:hypothetical protein|nr:hypothetical protein [Planctomycetaceae bacterium]
MKNLQQIIFGFYLLTYFIICLSIGLFGYEFISYYGRVDKLAFLPDNVVLASICGVAIFVTIILGLISRWLIPSALKTRIVLLFTIWLLILGAYKGLKLPDNYEVDRYRHIITNVTGFDEEQNSITNQRRKIHDIMLRPENTNFAGERYFKTEIIRQFNLPIKLRFAAGNLLSKKVDTIPIKINCAGESTQQKTDIINVKTDNSLVFYDVPAEFSHVIVEAPPIDLDVYPEDDHVNLRLFSHIAVNGYKALLVQIGKCALVVSVLYIFVALICLIFDVYPSSFFESINFWQEIKNIAWNIGQDTINLRRYFWLKKWSILIASVIGLICLGIASFNYSRMPEFPIEHSKSNLIWAMRIIWSITALIAFIVINNWRKATKIFWIHFVAWSIIFLLHWVVVQPGYFSTDSFYSIASIVALDKNWLVLWGSSMGLYRLLAMVSVSLVPYFGFFIFLQALFTAVVIGFIAQSIKKILGDNAAVILIILNVLLFFSIPFQCYTLAYVREVPYCLFMLLASVSIFLIQLQKNVQLKLENYFIGVVAVFLTAQFRADGLMIVGVFFCILLFRLICYQNFYYNNFLRPVFCFILIAVIATAWIGKEKNSIVNYKNIILAQALVPLFVNPDLADSDPDQTKVMILKGLKWDEIISGYRNDKGIATNDLQWNMMKSYENIDTRICFENPFLFFIVRTKCFFQYANMLGGGHFGMRDERLYTGQNFAYFPQTIDYARRNRLIPQETGYPSNQLFQFDQFLRNSSKGICKIAWSFLPHFVLLLVALMLYRYFPASASAAILILSAFPPIFFMAQLFNPMYYLFMFYGGLIILPLMAAESRYYRSQNNKQK